MSVAPGSAATGSLLSRVFRAAAEAGRAVFIPYLTHGFPSPSATPRLLERLAAAGAGAIELGVPFSDPLADGPTIQNASHQALRQGVTLESTLRLAAEAAGSLPPLVLFTYLNPVLRFGIERFCERAAGVGLAGVLITDLPVGSDPEREARFARAGPDFIRLAAPTTSPERLDEIARAGSGFLYYISRTGVTGARSALVHGLEREVEALRRRVNLPVAVGFGISTPAQAAAVARVADGVIIGSALIVSLERGESAFGALADSMAEAVRGVVHRRRS